MNKALILILSIFLLTSCKDENDVNNTQDNSVIINNSLYKETLTNNYTITGVQLNDNLLTIKISARALTSSSYVLQNLFCKRHCT